MYVIFGFWEYPFNLTRWSSEEDSTQDDSDSKCNSLFIQNEHHGNQQVQSEIRLIVLWSYRNNIRQVQVCDLNSGEAGGSLSERTTVSGIYTLRWGPPPGRRQTECRHQQVRRVIRSTTIIVFIRISDSGMLSDLEGLSVRNMCPN